jgi:hypothetical protein
LQVGHSHSGLTVRNSDSNPAAPMRFDYIAGHSNTAYAFNRTMWEVIVKHKEMFFSVVDGWYATFIVMV